MRSTSRDRKVIVRNMLKHLTEIFGLVEFKMKILVISRYAREETSSLLRFVQYLHAGNNHGSDVEISLLFSNSYVRFIYSGKGGQIAEAVIV